MVFEPAHGKLQAVSWDHAAWGTYSAAGHDQGIQGEVPVLDHNHAVRSVLELAFSFASTKTRVQPHHETVGANERFLPACGSPFRYEQRFDPGRIEPAGFSSKDDRVKSSCFSRQRGSKRREKVSKALVWWFEPIPLQVLWSSNRRTRTRMAEAQRARRAEVEVRSEDQSCR